MGLGAGQIVYDDDLTDLVNRTMLKPVGRVIASGTQALADNTAVAVQFTAAAEIDTHGFHNPVSSVTRVTPNLPGIYSFRGGAFLEAQSTPVVSAAWIRKNGSTNLPPAGRIPGFTVTFSLHTFAMLEMNGSTDYIELVVQQDSAGADNTNQASQFSSVIEWEYLRRTVAGE